MRRGEEHIQGRLFDRSLILGIMVYVRRYAWQITLAMILMLFLVGTSLALPYIMKTAIDSYLTGDSGLSADKRMEGIMRMAMLYGFVALASFAGRFAQSYLLSWIGQKSVFDMRSDLFKKTMHLPLSYYDRHPVGSIMTRVSSDVEAIQRAITEGLVPLAADLLGFIGILAFMFWLSWPLTLACLCLLPLMIVIIAIVNLGIRKAHRAVRRTESTLNSYTQEMLTGMQTVQLFNRQGTVTEDFSEHSGNLESAHLKSVRNESLFFPSVEILGALNMVNILLVGAWLVHRDVPSVTIGILIAFVMYMKDLMRPIEGFSQRTGIFQSAFASAERVFHLLNTEESIPEKEDAVPLTKLEGSIELRDVSFAYDGKHNVLKDLSFSVKPGQTVAVVGATGSGKTTLVHLLARFYDIQQGDILVDGVSIRDYDLKDLRRHIGIIVQEPTIFSGTVAQNITLGRRDVPEHVIQEAAAFVNAAPFIEQLPQGYDTPIGIGGLELSTGQKQLIALARAFAENPDMLLVLDEATANVDTQTEQLIQDSLGRLMKNRTSIVIAHRLSTIRDADLVLVLRNGELVEQGTHASLLKEHGYYHDLYQLLAREEER